MKAMATLLMVALLSGCEIPDKVEITHRVELTPVEYDLLQRVIIMECAMQREGTLEDVCDNADQPTDNAGESKEVWQ